MAEKQVWFLRTITQGGRVIEKGLVCYTVWERPRESEFDRALRKADDDKSRRFHEWHREQLLRGRR